jgi:hypothetical protein
MWHAAKLVLLRIKLKALGKTSGLKTLSHGVIIGGIIAVDCNDLESHQ